MLLLLTIKTSAQNHYCAEVFCSIYIEALKYERLCIYVFHVISLQVRLSITKPHSTFAACRIFALGLAERAKKNNEILPALV